ncbi:phosphatidylinositol transfer protein beta isoform [Oxyura jamaicensis]|uniref:phosphatidylinositol transfer protein beta isoform n=1 Tax=Oxyura jamaicensis TaxID=8884 RepID=UPI0015A61805|nr:phosphatidylinositol transfer protein beta isoform [Oxyura jamaicensis]
MDVSPPSRAGLLPGSGVTAVPLINFLSSSFSRVVLPCSVQEYQVGQLYSVAEASKNETGGGEGIQVLKNEPYEKDGEKGQYTHKIYHLKSKVPGFVRMIAPEGSLVFHEKAWNAYPYCRTIVTNEYMKDDFFIKIETWHKPDLGMSENVHNLDPNTWKSVEVVHIDIADRTQVEPGDYKADEDPALFQSVKTKRGPLGPNWKKELATDEECPKMCAYKLVTIKFKWWGLQNKVENFIQKQEKRIFTNFHRQLFCWIDKWIDLTMEDIRRMEDETQKELEALRNQGQVRGTSAANDE